MDLPGRVGALPMNGFAWNAVLAVAQGELGTVRNVAEQDSGHSTPCGIAALMC